VIPRNHEGSAPGTIIQVTAPSEAEIARILALKEKCEQRMGIGIVLTGDFLRALDKPGVGALAYIKGTGCVGFAFFYSFAKEEAEVSIFVDPDEDQERVRSEILQRTIEICKLRGHLRLLVMNDRRSTGVKQIQTAGGKYVFSEHRMESHHEPFPPEHDIDLLRVDNDDARLREVELECFGQLYSKPDQRRLLAMFGGSPIGKIDVYDEGKDVELTGFCVLPGLRGKGLGKAILYKAVRQLRKEGKERISLDVQTDNDVALSLYLKSGFEKQFTLDYYAIPLEDMNSDEQHQHQQ
jgi:ribosomal protein S18 acetylase RimI-like enzyme